MKEIFQEYGGIIITILAIVALIAVISALMADKGVVQTAFSNLVEGFANKSGVIGSTSTQTLK